jgi:hypothetical protein
MAINNSHYNKPSAGIYPNQNQNNDKTDGGISFSDLSGLRTISFEGKNLLLENESYINLLAFSFIILGFAPLLSLLDEQHASFLLIILGICFSICCFFICSKYRSFSVLNLMNNSFYKEYRFDSFTLYKTKPIYFSEINQIGLDHRSERPLTKGFKSGLLLWFFYAIQGKEIVPIKNSNMINGNVEKTAIVFLAKDGKKIEFNNYSDEIDSDDILLLLADTLSSYTNIPLKVANKSEELIVNNNRFFVRKITASREIMKTILFVGLLIVLIFFGLFIIVKFVD